MSLVARTRYAVGSDGFGNFMEVGKTPTGEYMVTISGRIYAVLPTHEEALVIAHKLIAMGR